MSIFPTKILLATDGSKEAELASRTATELAQSTRSAEITTTGGIVSPSVIHRTT